MPYYASVGPILTRYEVDFDTATLTPREAITLPANVQYAWPDRAKRFLYIASSDGGPGRKGTVNHLSAWKIGADGVLTAHGTPVPLPARPVHMTLDEDDRHALVAYNLPSGLTVHRIAADGTVGAEVPQAPDLDPGIFAHQVRVSPDGRSAIVVARGNDAEKDKGEEPGSLELFDYRDGVLSPRASIAPEGGYGFGPRHLDFLPGTPFVYVSIERQNRLDLFDLKDGTLTPTPRASVTALRGERGRRQLVGAVRVHPNGRFVYVTNRADARREHNGTRVFSGGENSIAVYAIDPATGVPARIQNADTYGYHPRTIAIDPTGRLLIAANIWPLDVLKGDRVETVPATLDVFRLGEDGRLTLASHVDGDTSHGMQFWSGWV